MRRQKKVTQRSMPYKNTMRNFGVGEGRGLKTIKVSIHLKLVSVQYVHVKFALAHQIY